MTPAHLSFHPEAHSESSCPKAVLTCPTGLMVLQHPGPILHPMMLRVMAVELRTHLLAYGNTI